MKRLCSLIMSAAILLCAFCVNVSADASMLVSAIDDWKVADYSGNAINFSQSQTSFLFKDFGEVSQAHIMTNAPNNLECAAIFKMESGGFVENFKNGNKLELLCYVDSDSVTDEIIINIGNFKVVNKIEKGKINHLVIPLSEIKHNNIALSSVKSTFDGNFISIGMKAETGRVDFIFSDIYISNGKKFTAKTKYTDLSNKDNEGQIVNFGKRIDCEYNQSGNTVPNIKNGISFEPMNSLVFNVKGEKKWTSDIALTKYFSKDELKGYKGIEFDIFCKATGDVSQLITLKFKSNYNGQSYIFTKSVSFKLNSIRKITLNFTDFKSNIANAKLKDDILNNVCSFEIQFAKYNGDKKQDFSFLYEIGDIYAKGYLPVITREVTTTQLPSVTVENYDIIGIADLYSILPTNAKSYSFTDYQNLQKFLSDYRGLTDEQKQRLSDKYNINQQKYEKMLELYQTMEVPTNENDIDSYALNDFEEEQLINNVTEKTFVYLFIAVISIVLVSTILLSNLNKIIHKKSKNKQK